MMRKITICVFLILVLSFPFMLCSCSLFNGGDSKKETSETIDTVLATKLLTQAYLATKYSTNVHGKTTLTVNELSYNTNNETTKSPTEQYTINFYRIGEQDNTIIHYSTINTTAEGDIYGKRYWFFNHYIVWDRPVNQETLRKNFEYIKNEEEWMEIINDYDDYNPADFILFVPFSEILEQQNVSLKGSKITTKDNFYYKTQLSYTDEYDDALFFIIINITIKQGLFYSVECKMSSYNEQIISKSFFIYDVKKIKLPDLSEYAPTD